MNYSEKLKDPRWQKKRLEILERDGWKCMSCGGKEKTLHVHHIIYFSHKDPWEINNGFLITLCESCHTVGPCDLKYKSCEECPEYKIENGCEGNANIPEEIVSCVGSLLNEIWKDDRIGDFFSQLGHIAMSIGDKK